MDFESEKPNTNGPAYTKAEERTGSPLDYVGEKLRCAIEDTHYLLHESVYSENRLSIKEASSRPAFSSFHYQITAFIALYNMLTMLEDPNRTKEFATYTRDEIKKLLDFIESNGSVSGK
tara:strand:- start:742 stop:1098 length:357 start_codon:yes stop_codon:yes gene_type:complete